MAQDNRTVDQRYNDQTKEQQDKLKKAHDKDTQMYGGMLSSGDKAYTAQKNDVLINKALSDLAGGPASTSMTHRQRGMSALRNELGDTERQHERFANNVDLALKNLDIKYAADKESTAASNEARKSAEKVSRSQSDAELGLKKQQFELDKSNSLFDHMYKLYTNRLVDNKTFKAMTGYDVKAIPKPHKTVHKSANVINMGNTFPAHVKDGYELHCELDKKTNKMTFFAVKDDTAAAMRSKNISLFENDRMKSDQQIYADLHYDGYATADATGKKKILEANKKDFSDQFGKGYYGFLDTYLATMSTAGKFYSVEDSKAVNNAFNNILAAASKGEDTKKAFGAYKTAIDNANTNLLNKHSDEPSWSLLTEKFPELKTLQYNESDNADAENKFLDRPPVSFTSGALVDMIKKRFGVIDSSLFKDVFDSPDLKELNVDWSQLSTAQLLAVKSYLTAKYNPRMVENGAMGEDEDSYQLIQEGKAIFEDVEKNYQNSIIQLRDSLEDDDTKKKREKSESEGLISPQDKFNNAVKDIKQYQKDYEDCKFYMNYDVDTAKKDLDNKKKKLNDAASDLIDFIDNEVGIDFIQGVGINDESLDHIRKHLESTNDTETLNKLNSLAATMKAYEDQTDQLEAEIETALAKKKMYQEMDYENGILKLEDFKIKSQEGAEKKNPKAMDVMFGDGEIQNVAAYAKYLNSDEVMEELNDSQLNERGGSNERLLNWINAQRVIYNKYTYMTDNEVGIYNYLLAKEGKSSADKFLSRIEETLNYREGTAEAAELKGKPVSQVLYSLLAGADSFGSGIRQLFSSDRLPTTATQFTSSAIYEDLGNGSEGKTIGQILYGVGNTVGYMAPSIFLDFVSGGIAAIPEGVASQIGTIAMALSTKGNAYNQALGQGYSKGEAELTSIMTGMYVYITARAMCSGLQNVSRIASSMPNITLGQQLAKLGVLSIGSAGVAFTRGTQITLAKNIAETLLMGDKSMFAQSVKAYQRDGFSKTAAIGLAGINCILTDPIETGTKMGVMAGLSVLPTAARTAYGEYTSGAFEFGGPTYSEWGQPALTAGAAQQANPAAAASASNASTALTPVYAGSAAPLQLPPSTAPGEAAIALPATGMAAYAGRLSTPQANSAYDNTPLPPTGFIQLGLSGDAADVAAKLDAYLMKLPAMGTGSTSPQKLLTPYTGGLTLPEAAAAKKAPDKVAKGVGDTAEELQALSDKTSLDLFDENVQNKYYGFALDATLGKAKSMYGASLQSLEEGIAQSAPQPAAELMQQADVVENRLGEVYEAAGVSKGYTPGTNTSNPQITSEASATDIGTLFGDYFDAIGADDMPPFAQFEKMYREGGDAWKELSLKMGWKEALKSGAVEPFTRFEDYKATAGVDGNGGMGYNETVNIDKFDFGKYLKSKIGNPPTDMVDPHAHHILFKKGLGPSQQALVQEGQALLRRYGIDPILGLENLVWAPNRIVGQHSIEALRYVVEKLKLVEDFGGSYNDIVEALEDLGEKAAKRRK